MGNKIADAALVIKMLRDAGYKNTSYAMAEIVDNSIEALAQNIDIYLNEKEVVRKRTQTIIGEILILDDGQGMSKEVLGKCLSFGWGTRLEGATGLGKFGFGLKGASISQARRIEIYSWKKSSEIYRTYLDFDEIINTGSDVLPDPIKTNIPNEYKKIIPNIPEAGTLVIWKNIDRLNPKTSSTIIQHLNKYMCRIFRHYISGSPHVSKVNINVKAISPKGKVYIDELLRANDPLYISTPNNMPSDKDGNVYTEQETNVVDDEFPIKVIDQDGIERNIYIKSTIAKPEIQHLTGNSIVGRHYDNNNGLSFVRGGRELELSGKGFFSSSEPRHRWHGIEIQFSPQLDEYFGVPNNKQSVRNFKNFDTAELQSLETEAENATGADKNAAKMKVDLHSAITKLIQSNYGIVKSRGKKRVGGKGGAGGSLPGRVTKRLNEIEPLVNTTSTEVAKTKSHDEKLKEIIDIKMKTDTSLKYDEALEIAQLELGNSIQIEEGQWPGNTFLDIQFKGNAAVATVNRNHPFFSEFYDVLSQSDDQKGFDALKIFLMAFARTEDLLQVSLGREEFERIRDKWGDYMKQLAELSG